MTTFITKAIVMGATGLVGKKLVEQLCQLPSCQKICVIVRQEQIAWQDHPKIEQYVLSDFLLINDEDVAGYSHAFSCLGTTLKQAGSKQHFYDIDFEINAHFADVMQMTQTHYILVSALGANAQSRIFYNQVKGELENYVQSLNLYRTSILRPSLLLGEHKEQRLLEGLTQKIYGKVAKFIPDHFKYKPISAEQVAHTMVEAGQTQTADFQIYDNLQIQQATF